MGIKFKNNAFATLASSITDVALTIPLTAGQGSRFPALAAGDYFYATLVDASANMEVVKVTARATDTLTVVRAQDGSSGKAYLAGDRIELRPCNASLLSLAQESSNFTAASGSGAYTATLDPVPTGYNTNQVYRIFFPAANTIPAPTLNLNALGTKTIKHLGGGEVVMGDIPSGFYGFLQYDGTDFLILNPWTQANVFTAAGTDTYTVTLTPAPLGYRTDQVYQILFTNANTIAGATMEFNGLGAKPIKLPDGAALSPGHISAGMVGFLAYDGVNLRLENPSQNPLSVLFAPQLVPSGGMLDFAGTVAPAGFLLCDGAAISRTTYAALFAAIGILWGAGDGSTTFNVPNFARRVAVGVGGAATGTLGNAVGNLGGTETHTLTLAQSPPHSHTLPGQLTLVGGGSGVTGGGGRALQDPGTTDSQGSGQAFPIMQPSAVVTKIIKT